MGLYEYGSRLGRSLLGPWAIAVEDEDEDGKQGLVNDMKCV